MDKQNQTLKRGYKYMFIQESKSLNPTLLHQKPPLELLRDAVGQNLEQWPSTVRMLRPFKTVAHVVVTSDYKMISLLPHNCNSATAMNHNVAT